MPILPLEVVAVAVMMGEETLTDEQYLRELARTVAGAMRVRAELMTEMMKLTASHASVERAGRLGARCAPAFDAACRSLARTPAPPWAQTCHEALSGWLESHLAVCDALTRAGGTRDPRHLSTAASLLRSARPFAERYNHARRGLARRLAAA